MESNFGVMDGTANGGQPSTSSPNQCCLLLKSQHLITDIITVKDVFALFRHQGYSDSEIVCPEHGFPIMLPEQAEDAKSSRFNEMLDGVLHQELSEPVKKEALTDGTSDTTDKHDWTALCSSSGDDAPSEACLGALDTIAQLKQLAKRISSNPDMLVVSGPTQPTSVDVDVGGNSSQTFPSSTSVPAQLPTPVTTRAQPAVSRLDIMLEAEDEEIPPTERFPRVPAEQSYNCERGDELTSCIVGNMVDSFLKPEIKRPRPVSPSSSPRPPRLSYHPPVLQTNSTPSTSEVEGMYIHPVFHRPCPPLHRPVAQPLHRPVAQPLHRPAAQPLHRPVAEPLHRPSPHHLVRSSSYPQPPHPYHPYRPAAPSVSTYVPPQDSLAMQRAYFAAAQQHSHPFSDSSPLSLSEQHQLHLPYAFAHLYQPAPRYPFQ